MIDAREAVILTLEEVKQLIGIICGEWSATDIKVIHEHYPKEFDLIVKLRDRVRERIEE